MKNIFAINKPVGPTSHDMIDQIRKITGEQKVGHAGTLDPLASGVLVVAVGRAATKQLAELVKGEKEYLATIKLGQNSTTDDEQGDKTAFEISTIPSEADIRAAFGDFVGTITQQPPVYSALKVAGKIAHRAARAGQPVELATRQVEVKSIELVNYRWPVVELKVTTGPGVYIRALARDLGQRLKTGGYLAGLVRIRVGQFTLVEAISTDQLKQQLAPPAADR